VAPTRCTTRFASWTIAAGLPTFEIAATMGTSLEQSSKIYGLLLRDSADRARAVLDLFLADPAKTAAEHPSPIVFSHPARHPARRVEADGLRTQGDQDCRRHEDVSTVARPAAYGADGDGRGRGAGDVRAGEGRARAGLHDGAIPPRGPDELPRHGRVS